MKDKWIKFMEQAPQKKTKVFSVMSKYSEIELGTIKWYPQWIHYCFFPTDADSTVYSDRCLITIADFITELNLKHKEMKTK